MPPTRKTPKATSASSKSDYFEGENQPNVPIAPQYVVNFSTSESDRALLQQIEETLAQHKAIDFSDLCKEALQQLLAPESPLSPPAPLEATPPPSVEKLQQQVANLEARIANLPGMKRFEYLESLVISLERKVDRGSQDSKGARSLPKSQITSNPENLELDPLLSHLSNLLEDF